MFESFSFVTIWCYCIRCSNLCRIFRLRGPPKVYGSVFLGSGRNFIIGRSHKIAFKLLKVWNFDKIASENSACIRVKMYQILLKLEIFQIFLIRKLYEKSSSSNLDKYFCDVLVVHLKYNLTDITSLFYNDYSSLGELLHSLFYDIGCFQYLK